MNILFAEFFKSDSVWVLLIIFLAKITEVTIATLRIILINKGQRNIGSALALVEITLWILIVGNVITDLNEFPLKAVMYGLGFAVGVYMGSLIENKLAIGNILIQAIVPLESGAIISEALREGGFGVTLMEGKGKEQDRAILFVYAKRKSSINASKLITSIEPQAMIIAHESRAITGGYTSNIRQVFK